jgi:phosphoglycolate phosphatase
MTESGTSQEAALALIVFDLDGTLVDSSGDLATAANRLVVGRGGRPLSKDAVVRMVGEGAAVLVRRALAASGLDPETPDALQEFLAIYDEVLLDTTRPYPQTIETLEELARRFPLAVLTNKPARSTALVLDGLAMTPLFRKVIGGDTRFGRKPDPAGLLHLIEQAGTSPASTLLVGDSPVDRATARNAGARVCLARFGFGFRFGPGDLDGSEILIDDPQALLRIAC